MISMLARWIVALTLGLSLLMGVVFMSSSLLPTPPNQSILARNPCDLPCFFDVTPGVTTHLQAIDLLTPYGRVIQVNSHQIRFQVVDQNGNRVTASFSSNSAGVIQAVRLEPAVFKADIAQLGDLMLTEQRPVHLYRTCAKQRRQSFSITIGALDGLIVGVVTEDALSPETPVITLEYATASWRVIDTNPTSFSCSVRMDWIGFAPIWKYFA